MTISFANLSLHMPGSSSYFLLLALAVTQQGRLMERAPKRPKTKMWLRTGQPLCCDF